MAKEKRGLEKRDILALLSAFIILGFLVFVLAAVNIPTIVFDDTDHGSIHTFNASEDSYYIYNFSINNSVGLATTADQFNVSEVNVTLPGAIILSVNTANNTDANGTTGCFHNYTIGGLMILNWRNVSTNAYLINGSNHSAWFAFNATAATPGQYTINVTVLHGSPATVGDKNITTYNINVTVNDTTAPDILASNFVPLANFNKSGSFVLNGTVTDNYKTVLGVNYVNVSIYNHTNGLNGSYIAKNLSGNYWNITIDTTQYPDGVYNITIYTNDTTNNVNSTNITNIRFDNTAPTVSMSCTPSTVNTGNSVTCSCSGTDSPAGVNSTTYTSSPSTANTGTFTETCSVMDTAGNSNTGSSTFIVEMSSGGGGISGGSGGATTSFYTKTIPQTSKEFSEVGTLQYSLQAKERVKIKISSVEHYVGIREITETKATIEIASDPVQIDLVVGEDTKVDVDNDGYYDVYVKLNSITSGKADVTINYIHEAIPEGEGAVSGGEVVGEPGGEQPTETTNKTWLWIVIALVVLAIIIGGGIAVKKRK